MSSVFNSRPRVRASFEVLTSRAIAKIKFLTSVRFSQTTVELRVRGHSWWKESLLY